MPYFHAVASAPASQDTSKASRIGVLLVNLGTPDAPTYFAVQRYLREFLSDRRVIDTSRLIWLPRTPSVRSRKWDCPQATRICSRVR